MGTLTLERESSVVGVLSYFPGAGLCPGPPLYYATNFPLHLVGSQIGRVSGLAKAGIE